MFIVPIIMGVDIHWVSLIAIKSCNNKIEFFLFDS